MGIQHRCMHEEKSMQTLNLGNEPGKERSANMSGQGTGNGNKEGF